MIREKIERCQAVYNNILMPNSPIIVECKIRNFNRFTKKTQKPYCPELWNILRNSMYSTAMELEGAIFGYQQHGAVSFVLKSSEDIIPGPYGNKIQDINSVVSSILSVNFMKHYMVSDNPPNTIGEGIFKCFTFSVTSIDDVVRYLISQQVDCQEVSLYNILDEELSKVSKSIGIVHGKSFEERINVLESECNVDYNSYSQSFRLGSCSFKVPVIVETNNGDTVRKKWILEQDSPEFNVNYDMIENIINTGQDIFDPNREK